MTFEYMQRVIVDATLEIDNIGDCVIVANNDLSEEYYLIIRTIFGTSEVLEYGPFVPDLSILPPTYRITYQRMDYNFGKLERIIDKFLNDTKRGITQARVTTLDEIKDCLVNPINLLQPEKC